MPRQAKVTQQNGSKTLITVSQTERFFAAANPLELWPPILDRIGCRFGRAGLFFVPGLEEA